MVNPRVYDVAVIGGGLAGLSFAIQCAKAGYAVILFEKEKYPYHKVCGEYISMESWNFLQQIGLPLNSMQLPVINKLVVTSPGGNKINKVLALGGFGISRYKIDEALAKIAVASGVTVMQQTKVQDVVYENGVFFLSTANENFAATIAAGCFGKRSNLDVKWQRPFIQQKQNKLNNYIGVKYHIKTNAPVDTIALHNFENGYCGMSAIEEGKYCLCYLTTAQNLQRCNNSIPQLEKNILLKNPYLKNIFEHSEFLWQQPVTIAQVSFTKKEIIKNHVLMLGDAAGMIAPLCGNGMSMALHSSKLAFAAVSKLLGGTLSRNEMEQQYIKSWKKNFEQRLGAGRLIQSLFGKPLLTNIFINSVKPFPALTSYLISKTHGTPF
jgi:menaquinone-9 beta-reductase